MSTATIETSPIGSPVGSANGTRLATPKISESEYIETKSNSNPVSPESFKFESVPTSPSSPEYLQTVVESSDVVTPVATPGKANETIDEGHDKDKDGGSAEFEKFKNAFGGKTVKLNDGKKFKLPQPGSSNVLVKEAQLANKGSNDASPNKDAIPEEHSPAQTDSLQEKPPSSPKRGRKFSKDEGDQQGRPPSSPKRGRKLSSDGNDQQRNGPKSPKLIVPKIRLASEDTLDGINEETPSEVDNAADKNEGSSELLDVAASSRKGSNTSKASKRSNRYKSGDNSEDGLRKKTKNPIKKIKHWFNKRGSKHRDGKTDDTDDANAVSDNGAENREVVIDKNMGDEKENSIHPETDADEVFVEQDASESKTAPGSRTSTPFESVHRTNPLMDEDIEAPDDEDAKHGDKSNECDTLTVASSDLTGKAMSPDNLPNTPTSAKSLAPSINLDFDVIQPTELLDNSSALARSRLSSRGISKRKPTVSRPSRVSQRAMTAPSVQGSTRSKLNTVASTTQAVLHHDDSDADVDEDGLPQVETPVKKVAEPETVTDRLALTPADKLALARDRAAQAKLAAAKEPDEEPEKVPSNPEVRMRKRAGTTPNRPVSVLESQMKDQRRMSFGIAAELNSILGGGLTGRGSPGRGRGGPGRGRGGRGNAALAKFSAKAMEVSPPGKRVLEMADKIDEAEKPGDEETSNPDTAAESSEEQDTTSKGPRNSIIPAEAPVFMKALHSKLGIKASPKSGKRKLPIPPKPNEDENNLPASPPPPSDRLQTTHEDTTTLPSSPSAPVQEEGSLPQSPEAPLVVNDTTTVDDGVRMTSKFTRQISDEDRQQIKNEFKFTRDPTQRTQAGLDFILTQRKMRDEMNSEPTSQEEDSRTSSKKSILKRSTTEASEISNVYDINEDLDNDDADDDNEGEDDPAEGGRRTSGLCMLAQELDLAAEGYNPKSKNKAKKKKSEKRLKSMNEDEEAKALADSIATMVELDTAERSRSNSVSRLTENTITEEEEPESDVEVNY